MATENLQATHDALRGLALYLLEMAARASLAGTAQLVVQAQNFVSMSQTVMRAVLDLEASLGGTTPPVPPTPEASPAGAKDFDTGAFIDNLNAQIQAETAAKIKAAMGQVQKQLQATGTGVKPAPADTPAPAPP